MSTQRTDSFIRALVLEIVLDRMPSAKTRLKITAKIKNTSLLPVVYCRYMAEYRLLGSMTAESEGESTNYELLNFRPSDAPLISQDDFIRLEPGQFFSVPLDLERFPNWHWIRRHSQPPVLTQDHGVPKLPSNHYRFSFALLPRLALYQGESGCHDHNFRIFELPKEAPGFSGDTRSCVQGYLAASPEFNIR